MPTTMLPAHLARFSSKPADGGGDCLLGPEHDAVRGDAEHRRLVRRHHREVKLFA